VTSLLWGRLLLVVKSDQFTLREVTVGREKWPIYSEAGYCWPWKLTSLLWGRLLLVVKSGQFTLREVTVGREKWPVYFEGGYCWSWKVTSLLWGRLLLVVKSDHFSLRQITTGHVVRSVYLRQKQSIGTPHSMHVKLGAFGSNVYWILPVALGSFQNRTVFTV